MREINLKTTKFCYLPNGSKRAKAYQNLQSSNTLKGMNQLNSGTIDCHISWKKGTQIRKYPCMFPAISRSWTTLVPILPSPQKYTTGALKYNNNRAFKASIPGGYSHKAVCKQTPTHAGVDAPIKDTYGGKWRDINVLSVNSEMRGISIIISCLGHNSCTKLEITALNWHPERYEAHVRWWAHTKQLDVTRLLAARAVFHGTFPGPAV